MKTTLIMKNGMSIDITDSKELWLNGKKITVVELLHTLSSKSFQGEPLENVELLHKIKHEGKDHTFNYMFPIDAFNWGYVHETK